MPLGIEQNNLAPALIQSNGAALVQGIRQIGQQISGHITELQTKRDLGAIAQEMQNVNVQSNEFPVQLAQLISRHPMAARDDRGKMLLGTLGQAHGQWQAGEAEARAFQRQMQMQTARDKSAREFYDYKRTQELGDPQNVGGSLVVPRDPVSGEPKVIFTPPPRVTAGSQRPIVANPGDIVFDPTGKEIARGLPKTPSTASELSKQRFNADLIKSQASSLKSEIEAGIRRRDSAAKEQAKALEDASVLKGAAKAAAELRFKELDDQKHAIEKEVNEKKTRHLELQERLGAIQARVEGEAVEPGLGAAPAGVLPPIGAMPTKQIDRAMAAEFLKQAGGDAAKARQMAKEQGFTF